MSWPWTLRSKLTAIKFPIVGLEDREVGYCVSCIHLNFKSDSAPRLYLKQIKCWFRVMQYKLTFCQNGYIIIWNDLPTYRLKPRALVHARKNLFVTSQGRKINGRRSFCFWFQKQREIGQCMWWSIVHEGDLCEFWSCQIQWRFTFNWWTDRIPSHISKYPCWTACWRRVCFTFLRYCWEI